MGTQQRLKLYSRVPPHGLVVYCGTIVTDEGKERRVNIDFEPFKPINTSLYLCDNKFHTEALHELLEDDDKFGFIIMDGHGTLYGTLCGNTREVLHKFTVELPKKHGRGGQSALRFARLRLEKRHNDVRNVLSQSDMFDERLQAVVMSIVDVSYGGENGFSQAIELSADTLANVKFVQEKKLISKFFDEISKDTGKYVFGVEDTLQCMEMGAVETLIVFENLDVFRYDLQNMATGEMVVKHLTEVQAKDDKHFHDEETGVELETKEKILLVEWIAEKYKNFGCVLEFVTNKSQEGSQFCRGFGGIGGLLRYAIDLTEFEQPASFDDFYDDD